MTLLSLLRKYAGVPETSSEPSFLADQEPGDTADFARHWATAIGDQDCLEAFIERVAILEIDGELDEAAAIPLALQLYRLNLDKES